MTRQRATDRSVALAARLVAGAIILLGLYYGRPVLIPLGLSILIAFMLQPAVRRLRKAGLGNGSACILTVLAGVLVLGGLSWFIGGQVQSLTAEIPKYKENLISKIGEIRQKLRGGSIDQLKSTMTEVLVEVKEQETAAAPETPATAPEKAARSAADELPVQKVILQQEEPEMAVPGELSTAGAILEPLGNAGLVLLLVILFLVKWSDLRQRLFALVGRNLTTTTAALEDAGTRVARYLTMQFVVNAATGLLVWAGLSIIGVPYAGLMGLCAGLFRYVPYAGPIIAAALPMLMSFITSSGWGPVIATAVLFLVLELVLNNIIEPWLYGSKVGVSEIGIIIATLVWTFLWGPAGLVLATPLTVCVVVLGENVSGLSFLAKLLSDKVNHPVHETLTQRLMAGDMLEAADILHDQRDRNGSQDTYDMVVVPALARIRHEQRLGHLDAAAAAGIAGSIPGVFLDGSAPEETTAMLEKSSRFAVWSLCPVSEAVASLLESRLQGVPVHLEQFRSRHLASEVSAAVENAPPLGVLLLSLDDSDFQRLANTLRRLRRNHPALSIIAARWGEQAFTPAERDELTRIGVSEISSTPADLRAWLMPRAVNVARVIPADPAPPPEDSPALPVPT